MFLLSFLINNIKGNMRKGIINNENLGPNEEPCHHIQVDNIIAKKRSMKEKTIKMTISLFFLYIKNNPIKDKIKIGL